MVLFFFSMFYTKILLFNEKLITLITRNGCSLTLGIMLIYDMINKCFLSMKHHIVLITVIRH